MFSPFISIQCFSWACELQVSRIFGVSFCVRQKKRLVSTVPWLLQNLSIFHWRNSIIAQRMTNILSYYTIRPLFCWNSHFCVSHLAGKDKEHPCHLCNCFDLLRILPFLFFIGAISLGWVWFYSFSCSFSSIPGFVVIGVAPRCYHVDTVFCLWEVYKSECFSRDNCCQIY